MRISLLPCLSWLVVVSQAAPHPVLQCPGLSSCYAVFFLSHTVFFFNLFHFILLIEPGQRRGKEVTLEKTRMS